MFRVPILYKSSTNKEVLINKDLQLNIDEIKRLYTYGVNKDFTIRELTIRFQKKKAVLCYYGSISNETKIRESIIRPLLESEGEDIPSIVTVEGIEVLAAMNEAVDNINSGQAVLFVEGMAKVYSFGVADYKHRTVEKSENETVVKGPKEAFTESLSVNLSLIRKRIHDENLIAEGISVGERSKEQVTVLYIKDLANEQLVQNVRDRLNSINVDNIRNIEQLEQYIEDRPYSLVPTILYTERPDRSAAFLEEGYIILIMESSSASLILPATFWSFFHNPEDHYLKLLYGNFSRIIRMTAIFITLFTSAIYISITTFHSELIPPDLLLAIANARERVPFPTVFEVVIMEFAFELIREAGLRIPNPLGPTIGIVGALILGQAAVEANIISPIIVIVAALSGLSSFAISDISFNYTIRLSRFLFILSAAMFGILGMTICFVLWVSYLVSVKSFGVSYFAPLSPHYLSSGDLFVRKTLKKEYFRPGFLKVKDFIKKPVK